MQRDVRRPLLETGREYAAHSHTPNQLVFRRTPKMSFSSCYKKLLVGYFGLKLQTHSGDTQDQYYILSNIHSIKWLGKSWLVHVANVANELTALHFKKLVSIHFSILQRAFRVLLKHSTFPSSTCIGLLRVILYAICAAAVCLKYSQHCNAIYIGSSKFLYMLAAAVIIYN